MRVAVFSDTHGRLMRLPAAVRAIGTADALLHLGDFASDAEAIGDALGIPAELVFSVHGNCDLYGHAPAERVVTLDGVRLFMTHGNRYESDYALLDRADREHCAAALFGHTHRQQLSAQGACLLLNPGSLSLPRGGAAGYAILTIEHGEITVKMCTVS